MVSYCSCKYYIPAFLFQLSIAGIGDAYSKSTPRTPMCLSHILWFLIQNIRFSTKSCVA